MIVEILGAKMLSPYVGTSHFVWTAQIAVALIALTFGYWVGGWVVDKSQRVSSLYWAILAAAAYLALTVAIVEPVAYACLDLKPFALGSLLASMALYFVPLALLAMVGPFFVRVLTSSVNNVGGNVGRLTAVSTFGSFAGTILIGYVLIPFLPNSWTMYLLSLLLAVISLVHFIVWRGKRETIAPVILLLIGTATLGYGGVRLDQVRHTRAEEKFYGNSNFGILQVLDTPSQRFYLNDYLVQNTYDTNTQQSTSLFTYMLHGLPRVYVSNIQDVLCIGMGIGIAPMDFARDGARVDVVEINPAIVPVAEQWFDLKRDKLNITIGDGRQFLNDCKKTYDVVALDAFLGESSPSHLMTREAFVAMRRVLKPDGVLVINSFGNLTPGKDFFTASLYKTLTNVFPSVRVHIAAHSSDTGGNTFYVASERAPLEMVNTPDTSKVHPYVQGLAQMAYAGVVEPGREYRGLMLHLESGHVLTDDFNSVDFYDARNREEIRRNLASKMKREE